MRSPRAFTILNGHGIGFRLRAATAVLVIMAALQGVIGLYFMAEIQQRVGDMYSQELVALEAMDDAKSAMYRIRGDSLEHVLAATETSEERLATEIADQRNRAAERVRQYRMTRLSPGEAALLNTFELHFSTYTRTVERQILPLSASGDKAQAEVLARGPAVTDFRRAREAMNDLMDYGLARAQRRQQNAVADYNRALWTAVSITLTISAMGASVAFFLARSITRPLQQVIAQFSQIASGDLDSPIESNRRDEIGELLRALGEMQSRLSSSIAERHESQAALRGSEERFRALFEGSPDAITLTDPHDPVVFKRIVACNDAAGRMNGYSREELVGQSVDVLHPESTQGDGFAESLTTLRREGAIAIEATHRRKDGTLFPIETRISLITVSGQELILGIDRDITERKKAQEALCRSEESLATAQRIAHLGNWDWDMTSDRLFWSAEVYRIFDLPPSDFEAMYDAFMLRVHPEDRDLVQKAMDAAVHGGQPYSIEHRIVRPSGETRMVHERAEVVRDEFGRPLSMIGTVHDVTERSLAEQDRALLASLVESSEEAIIGQTLEGIILTWNSSAERLYGYSAEEARGKSVSMLTPANQADEFPPILERISRGERLERLETSRLTKDGALVEVSLTVSPIKDFAGRVVGAAVVAQDITERKQAERALRESEAGLRAAQRIARLGDWSVDLLTDEVRWSEEYCRILGYHPGEVRPSYEGFMERVHPDAYEQVRAATQNSITTGEDFEIEFPVVRQDGTIRFLHERSEVLRDQDGRPIAIQGIGHDVTERKHLEVQLQHQATHDALTGLPNRTLFSQRLNRVLGQPHECGVSVLLLDLDGFKYVNDSLGHDAGDQLLIKAAQRIHGTLRPTDTVARLGGDEFAVLLPTVGDRNGAAGIADRIATSLREALVIEGRETFVTATIGITVLDPKRRATGEDVLREADMAMYRAKTSGKGRYELFTEDIGVGVAQRALLESELHRAIEREEFEVHYQPIVDLESERLVGFEALTRWRHPKRGLVAPGEFIGLAEETGLILPLGAGTLRQACRQASGWDLRFGGPLVLSVNLSARELRSPDLASCVHQTLLATGLPARFLQLEITESAVMEDLDAALSTLRKLKGLGVKLALDDFGTGYSSLSYLKVLPVDALKIDKSFTCGLGNDSTDAAIAHAMISLASALGMSVTAEGVETEQQRDRLLRLGCELAQGHLFGAARPAEDLGVSALAPSGRAPDWRGQGRAPSRGPLLRARGRGGHGHA